MTMQVKVNALRELQSASGNELSMLMPSVLDRAFKGELCKERKMSGIAHYEREFVERTRQILKTYKGKYKLSNTINCTLGLIVLPNEMLNAFPNPIWDTPIVNINDLNYLQVRRFEPIRKKKKNLPVYYPKTLKILLKKIRNGLAHQTIEPVNNAHGLFTGIIIRNYFSEGANDLDLEIEFNRKELENFALFIAGKYLGE